MDKSIKLAVAGSGKTRYIIDNLNEEDQTLILTYTNSNHQSIIGRIDSKFSTQPTNIEVLTFFNFLYQFCFNPFLSDKVKAKGIDWEYPPTYTRYLKNDNIKHYLSSSKLLYHNRISKLILERVDLQKLRDRLQKYYSRVFIDEIQDIGGYDFNLLLELVEADIELRMVGDFYQHTYSTSNDGKTNLNLHDDLKSYIARFKEKDIEVGTQDLNKSWRCSKTVCEFIRKNIGIEIYSRTERETYAQYIEDEKKVSDLFNKPDLIKLFYRSSDSYRCLSANWGESKGEDHHDDVCVVLNKKTTKYFKKKKLKELPARTRNKLYVACSRPHNNLYLVPQKIIDRIK